MATERTCRTNFVWKRIANASNKPSINTVYFDRWHGLCMRPKFRDDCRLPDDGMPDTVPMAVAEPSQRELSLALNPNSLVD